MINNTSTCLLVISFALILMSINTIRTNTAISKLQSQITDLQHQCQEKK